MEDVLIENIVEALITHKFFYIDESLISIATSSTEPFANSKTTNTTLRIMEYFVELGYKNPFWIVTKAGIPRGISKRLKRICDNGNKIMISICYAKNPKEIEPICNNRFRNIEELKGTGVTISWYMRPLVKEWSANEKETKERFTEFAYEFLIKELQLNDKRIFVTVHPEDIITANTWKKMGVKNIIEKPDNVFVSPYGKKSALRTEILWQKSDQKKSLVELWNLVFTQFDSKTIFVNPSIKIGADSGVSLERIVSAIEDKNNNYENSMWKEYVNYIKNLGKNSYDISKYRKIADLSNAAIGLVKEGLIPDKKTQCYMLRKIMRNFYDLCDFDGINPEKVLKFNQLNSSHLEIFANERNLYYKTVQNGLKQAKKEIDKFGVKNLDKDYLKSTYGLSNMYIEKIISRYKKIKKKI